MNTHTYLYSRTFHFFKCWKCNGVTQEEDGDPVCYEDLGPQLHEVKCVHCGEEADAEEEV